MIDHRIRPQLGDRLHHETERAGDAGNLGIPGRIDIEMRIADERGAPAAAAFDHRVDRRAVGLGLARPQRIATDDAAEAAGEVELVQQPQRQPLQLVGDDRDLDPISIQLVERRHRARKGSRMDGDVRFVIIEQ